MKQWKFSIKGLGWNTNEDGKFWKEDEWWRDNETGLKHQKNKKKPIWECYGYYMCGKYQKGEFHAGLGSEKKLRNIRVFPNSLALCEGWLSSHLCLAGGLIIIVDVWEGYSEGGEKVNLSMGGLSLGLGCPGLDYWGRWRLIIPERLSWEQKSFYYVAHIQDWLTTTVSPVNQVAIAA